MTAKGAKERVGIFGGSGYIGSELLRYLTVHPRAELAWVSAHTRRGEKIAEVLPNLRGFIDLDFCGADEAERRTGEVRAVFVALPHNQSQGVIPRLKTAHPEVVFIDMAGDFRTDDPAGYRRYYGRDHGAPEWLERFVYGFTEYQRDRLAGAELIANPGCFATGMLLLLAPLARAGRLRGDLCLTGITGSSGAGNKPLATTHHPERATNVRSYKPLVHQHLLEVEGFLRGMTGDGFRLLFVPQSGPLVRGNYVTLFTPHVPAGELQEIYRGAYDNEPLVGVVEGSPELRWVQGTPRSFVGFAGDAARGGVAFSVIDNLGKGAAGQAIQNFNLAMGIPETEGLEWPGGYL
ncbi:MAG: N-acetyl-gamma-glutamyl-phosphate reductase [Planctomycetota bacterium]|nr:N-acetyl-gamma-glutamyl-phosphate reductase [Planctomycetota bacterium]